jgi:hypothetical protein
VIIELSELAANVVLDALADIMHGGRIELRSEANSVLAVLKLSDPVAQEAVAGILEFNKIAEEDAALRQGEANSAQIIGADGERVLSCDVGDEDSDAVIKLNTTKIYRGGPVRLKSFYLIMPTSKS